MANKFDVASIWGNDRASWECVNSIGASGDERKGATSLSATAEDFRAWINDMELVDLALNDRKYTWFRGQSCSYIDRSLVSLEWLDAYPDTRLRGGQRGLSDHCPLIVEGRRLVQGTRLFCSLDSWFTHEGFLRIVKEDWRGLTKPLGKWHKQHFGNIPEKLKRFEEEIKKVDDMVSNGVYDGTVEARRKALVRCCELWRLVKNHARITVAIRDFYRNLFQQEASPNISFRDGLINRLEREEAQVLEMLPSEEEVKDAVWDCESSKAPDSDGYNMNFIKRCREDIGVEFTKAVMTFFETGLQCYLGSAGTEICGCKGDTGP
ncbi:uncharacterized protein [Arachis hypogaea]|uniref:uncharacterized protein n=1 Tax=Arachis hypogaea TaxID=3818 RepID=UPI000DEC1EFD|nr:uncharacterized protein LOC112717208 [Arachis hypogaea]